MLMYACISTWLGFSKHGLDELNRIEWRRNNRRCYNGLFLTVSLVFGKYSNPLLRLISRSSNINSDVPNCLWITNKLNGH